MTLEQFVAELECDMKAISRVAKPLSMKWQSREEEFRRMSEQLTPPLRKRLEEASQELNVSMGRFDR